MFYKLCLFMTLISITSQSNALVALPRARNTTPVNPGNLKLAIHEISRLIQACKAIIEAAHLIAVQQAAGQLQRPHTIKSILMEQTDLPKELTTIVAGYEPTCINYEDLLIQVMTPFASDIQTISKESENVVANEVRPGHSDLFSTYVPHNPFTKAELDRWQAAGFASRPQRVKLDYSYCTNCSTDISPVQYLYGDYSQQASYMEPADYHNYSLTHPEAIEKLQAVAIQTEDQLNNCTNIPKPTDPTFDRYVLRRLNMKARIVKTSKQPSSLMIPAELWHRLHATYNSLHGWGKVALYLNDPEGFKKLNLQTYQDIQNTLVPMSKEMSSKE